MTDGLMKQFADGLTVDQVRALAIYLTGKQLIGRVVISTRTLQRSGEPDQTKRSAVERLGKGPGELTVSATGRNQTGRCAAAEDQVGLDPSGADGHGPADDYRQSAFCHH